MKIQKIVGILLVASAFATTHASVPDDIAALIHRSEAARQEGVPQGLVHPLRKALERKNLTSEAREALAVELGRALLDAGREREAVEVLEDERSSRNPLGRFWLAQSLAQAGNYERALKLYDSVSDIEDFAFRGEALLGKARMLEASGRLNEALRALGQVPRESRVIHPARLSAAGLFLEAGGPDQARLALESLIDPNRRDDEARAYLLARLELEHGDPARALERYENLEFRNRRLAAGAAIGEADALLRLGKPRNAERRLEKFLFDNPRAQFAPELLAKLDEIYGAAGDSSNAALKRLEHDENPGRSTLATFYLARNDERQGRYDRAIRTYREFLAEHSRHELAPDAATRLANLLLESDDVEGAVRVLDAIPTDRTSPQQAAALDFLWGVANFRSGNFREAAKRFERASQSELIGDAGMANSILSAGYAGEVQRDAIDDLSKRQPNLAEEVELAGVLHAGSERNPRTGEALLRLAEEASQADVRRRAALGLAEWHWINGHRDEAVSSYRRIANTDDEQTQYFAVYLADDGTPEAARAVSAAAEDFLHRHPNSRFDAAVRMKWGEVLSREGDERSARVQFQKAAETAVDPAVREAALFSAARASARLIDKEMLEEAVLTFEEVRQLGGPLAEQALFEMALVQNALDRPSEALVLLDRLSETTKDQRLRIAAQLRKGYTLFAMGEEDPKRMDEAIVVWRAVAADPDASVAERNEAVTRAASAEEKRGNIDAALAGYYEVLTAPRDTQPEYFWYYQAGFDAARLLEERSQFKEAVAIYEKMAVTDGPRAADAEERVKTLRLENFIWDN